MKNKLGIILSCIALTGNIFASRPEAAEQTGYPVQLCYGTTGNEIEGKIYTITQDEKDLIDKHGVACFKALLDKRFKSKYNFASVSDQHMSLTRDETTKVPVVVRKVFFDVRDEQCTRIYIRDPSFIYEVSKGVHRIPNLKEGSYDLSDLIDITKDSLILGDFNIGWFHVPVPLINITDDSSLEKFCDSICFIQELVKKRNQTLTDTLGYLRALCLYGANKYSLTRQSDNQYVLTAKFQDNPARTAAVMYELFLKDEFEESNWYRSEYAEDVNVNGYRLPNRSRMIVDSIKFADQEYHFNTKRMLSDEMLMRINELTDRERQAKLNGYELCHSISLREAYQSFNIEELFKPIDRELS